MSIYRYIHRYFSLARRRVQPLPAQRDGALLFLAALIVLPTSAPAQQIDEIIVYGDLAGIRNRERADQRDRARRIAHSSAKRLALRGDGRCRGEPESLKRRIPGEVLSDTRCRRTRPVHRAPESFGGSSHRWRGLQRNRGRFDAFRHRANRSVSRTPGHPVRRQRIGGTHFAAQPRRGTRGFRTPAP